MEREKLHDTKAAGNEGKSKQMELHENETKICTPKHYIDKVKKMTNGMRVNIPKSYI